MINRRERNVFQLKRTRSEFYNETILRVEIATAILTWRVVAYDSAKHSHVNN